MKKKVQLNLGCGVAVIKDFINVDKYYTLKQLREKKGKFQQAEIQKGGTFVRADMGKLPFKDNFADYIETIDAVEHISFRKIQPVFDEMYRVLKPKGRLMILTPNFDALAADWVKNFAGKAPGEINMMKYLDIMETIYGNQTWEGEFHRIPYNPYFLGYLMQQAGFKVKKIKMTIFPQGSWIPAHKMKTQKWDKNTLTRTEMIMVEATK